MTRLLRNDVRLDVCPGFVYSTPSEDLKIEKR